MKYISLFIFILTFFNSCDSKKILDKQKSISDSLIIFYDTLQYTDLNLNEYEYKEDKLLVSNSNEYRQNVDINNEYNITNYIDTTKILDNGFGTIAYNVPQKFVVNEYSTIKLRISKSKEIESVIIGDRNIPIVGTNSDDNIIIETIQIDSVMLASLYTDEGLFEVTMFSKNEKQSLLESGYTEWVWRVRPLKSGNHYIKMLITISGKDIVVYEKNIPVESNWKFSLLSWFTKWWQSITTTLIIPIIIPFIIWLYRRNKNKNII